MEPKIRIFIGSGEASALPCKVLVHSLRQHTHRPLDIWVFNGTHNAVEHNDEPPFLTSLSLRIKYRQETEFSFYRYLIPELCQYQGRAIYLDSDMICRVDIGELFDTPLADFHFLAKADGNGTGIWAPSVMLIDCERTRFDLEGIFDEIERGCYALRDFTRLSPAFCLQRAYRVGSIDARWNEFDRYKPDTKLVHYTELMTQPWKFPNHPFGELWFQYLCSALSVGAVTPQDIKRSIKRAYVRPDILAGNWARGASFRRRLTATVNRLAVSLSVSRFVR